MSDNQNTHPVKAYRFQIFEGMNVIHGVFTRNGGVSPRPWASLNVGGTVGDSRENVIENRRRIFEEIGQQVETIYDVWQVHGVKAICTSSPRPLDKPHELADIILTNRPGITLFMRFADCVPILLFDPVQRVIGMVHAGWKGTLDKVASVAVKNMQDQYGSKPSDIIAGIGPSIGVDHYEVGNEVVQLAQRFFGKDLQQIIFRKGESSFLDLWKANELVLQQSGVQSIQISGMCTACCTNEWFSHRGDKGKTGRFGAVMALKVSE